jgi:hypothetical protein
MDMAVLTGSSWLGVLVAAVLAFVLGALWYGPLFGRVWMAAAGVTEAQVQGASMARVFALAFLLVLVQAVLLRLLIHEATFWDGVTTGLMVGGGWVATATGIFHLFEHRPPAHLLVNAGYAVLSFALMGGVLGGWS